MGTPDGTFYFNNEPNQLDQVLVNRNMAATDSVLWAESVAVQILKFPGTVAAGEYPKPRPFRIGANPDLDGYSDHFPICLQVTEAD
jgi:hypothetical protein